MKESKKKIHRNHSLVKSEERKDLDRILKGLLKPNDTLEKEVLRIRGGKSSYSDAFVKTVVAADFIQKKSPEVYKDYYAELTGKTGLPKPSRETLGLIKWNGDEIVTMEVPVISSFNFAGIPFHIHRTVVKVGDDWRVARNSYSVSSDFGGRILDGDSVKSVYQRAKKLFKEQGEERVKKVINSYKRKVV